MAQPTLFDLRCVTDSNATSNQLRGILPSRNVCRSLFGQVDHDKLREELENERRQGLEEKIEKYNFDFVTGLPLAGRFSWEKMVSDSSSGREKISPRERTPLEDNRVTESAGEANKVKCLKRKLAAEDRKNTNQSLISSHFPAKKRKPSDELTSLIENESKVNRRKADERQTTLKSLTRLARDALTKSVKT